MGVVLYFHYISIDVLFKLFVIFQTGEHGFEGSVYIWWKQVPSENQGFQWRAGM